jgi:hypothetical protein
VNEALHTALARLGPITSQPQLSSETATSQDFLSSLAALLILSDTTSYLRRGGAVTLGTESGTVLSVSPHFGKAMVVLSSASADATGKIDPVEVPVTDLLPKHIDSVFQQFRCTRSSLLTLISCVRFFERCHADEKDRSVALMLGNLGSAAMSALASALEESLHNAKSAAESVQSCFEELVDCLRPISRRSTVACQPRALHWQRQQALSFCIDSLVDESSNDGDERIDVDTGSRQVWFVFYTFGYNDLHLTNTSRAVRSRGFEGRPTSLSGLWQVVF